MARLKDLRPGVDLTRGIGAGLDILSTRENIKKSKAQEKRAQATLEINKQAQQAEQGRLSQQEEDRTSDREIDLTQKMYGIAVDNKDLEAADQLLFRLGELSGTPIAGNHVEINELINRRAEFVKNEDVDSVEALDTYMAKKYGTTPEGAAKMLGREGLAEEFKTEREFETKIEQEQEVFDIKKDRTKLEQEEVRKTTATAIAGVEGLDDTMKAMIPLISSGEVSAGVLNVLSAQTGVTFRTGLIGTEGANKGKPVTASFDKSGKKLFEFPEAAKKDKAQRRIIEFKNPLTDEVEVRGVVWGEDANGNPILKYVKPEEVATDQPSAALKLDAAAAKAIENKLSEIGESGDLTPSAFLASIENIEELTEEEIIRDYRRALAARGVTEIQKEEPKTPVEKKKSRKKGRRLLDKLLKTGKEDGA